MSKKTGQGIITCGVLGILTAVLVDVIPSAKPGIQATQILGIEVSALILSIGIWVFNSKANGQIKLTNTITVLIEYIIKLPVFVWILIGFFISYLFFWIAPLFLNETLRMDYLVKYLPDRYPIGTDLIRVLDLTRQWFQDGQSPYPTQFYTPFTYIFFAPLLLVDSYPKLFTVITLFSVVAFAVLTIILPIKLSEMKNMPVVLLFFITGLFSYGVQFELERGQYNIFTFLLCLLSIYIFHKYKEQRLLAYLLFTLSIQLKLYPAIFIVMFVDDWKEWKVTLRRFALIGGLNFALLFVMGWNVFMEFIQSVSLQIITPVWNMDVNHSINSFVDMLATGTLKGFPLSWQFFAHQFSEAISTILMAAFLVIFIFALLFSKPKQGKGVDTYLLLTCTIGALILPVSMDYKLCILTTPLALFLGNLPEIPPRHKFIYILLIIGISIVYSSLLAPFKYKPDFLRNSFPPLLLILLLATALNFINIKNKASNVQI